MKERTYKEKLAAAEERAGNAESERFEANEAWKAMQEIARRESSRKTSAEAEVNKLREVIRNLEETIRNLNHPVTCQCCGIAKDSITLFISPGGISSLWICLSCMDGLIKAGWRARP